MKNLFERVKQLVNPDMAFIISMNRKFRDLKIEMNMLFPEREALIDQLFLALIVRYHVLQMGPPGTGKTAVATTLFKCIKGAVIWDQQLTASTSESFIFGSVDPQRMRQDGVMLRQTKRTILEAHFALADEMLDLSAYLVRAFLRLMNERQYTSGGQTYDAPLHILIATTNRNIKELLEQDSQYEAVIDRFLLTCTVSQMEASKNEEIMVDNSLSQRCPTVELDFEDIKKYSDLVTNYRLMVDPQVVSTYVQVVNAYEDHLRSQGRYVSNRRMNQLAQLPEAWALMMGRTEVDLDDLYCLKFGLCDVGVKQEMETFMHIVQPIIEEAKKKRKQPVDMVQMELLKQYATSIQQPSPKMSDTELIKVYRQMSELRTNVERVIPQFTNVEAAKKSLLVQLDTVLSELNTRLQGG